MVKRVQMLGHDTAGADAFIGRVREVTVVTTNSELRVHDGSTAGGAKIALADLSNVNAATTSVDGKMAAADKLKLDGIETAATADQTGAQIKSLYEAESDTNAFTDADHTKLDGIETAADVTDATNVNAAGAVMESDYDANTILAATNDNTPVALTVDASRILGRKSTGGISAMTAAEAKAILSIANTDVSGLGSFATLSAVPDDHVTLARLAHGTQGGILYYGASGVPTELAAGPSGYFLKTLGASNDPAWAEVPGNIEKVHSFTTTGTPTNIDFESIINDTDYDFYLIYFHSLHQSSSNIRLEMVVGTGATPTYETGASDYTWNYDKHDHFAGTSISTTHDSDNLDDSMIMTSSGTTSAGFAMRGEILIMNPHSTDYHTGFFWNIQGHQSTGNRSNRYEGGGEFYNNGTVTPVTAIRIRNVGGTTFVAGAKFVIYGIKF